MPRSIEFFAGSSEDVQAAAVLDQTIATRLARKDHNLAADYLAIGRGLVEMHDTRGFKLVGYPTFEGYLKAKPAFGRTYYSYLIKLGRARGLERHLPPGIGGAQLVEYARATDYPDKIGDLIEATWSEFGNLTVRMLSRALCEFVEEHREIFRKSGRKSVVKRRPGIVGRLAKLLEKLGSEERSQLLDAVDDVVRPYRNRPDAHTAHPSDH